MSDNLFYIDELESFIGDCIEEYDIDAIVDVVTEIDYSSNKRYWKDISEAELFEICEAYRVLA